MGWEQECTGWDGEVLPEGALIIKEYWESCHVCPVLWRVGLGVLFCFPLCFGLPRGPGPRLGLKFKVVPPGAVPLEGSQGWLERKWAGGQKSGKAPPSPRRLVPYFDISRFTILCLSTKDSFESFSLVLPIKWVGQVQSNLRLELQKGPGREMSHEGHNTIGLFSILLT
jgi:hypothetical protein